MSLSNKLKREEDWFASDEQFNQLYPSNIQLLSLNHWTPLAVAVEAANFLTAESNAKILDIGSGIGKFCLTAAHYNRTAFFYGIEQRIKLINHAEAAKEILGLPNISFFHGNFTQLNFADYDHFYFFNSFYENLKGTGKIDNSLNFSSENYDYYNRYLHNQLAEKPTGTRVATYHSLGDEMPDDYYVVNSQMDEMLKCWIKV